MNVWNFTGNLGKDAETRFTTKGEGIVNFSVAVKSGYGDNALTTWVRCSMFGKRGEAVSQYLTKGQLVGISGEACLRPWKDKEGVEQYSLEVRVNDLTLLSNKPQQGEQSEQPRRAPKPVATDSGFDDMPDELPF